MKIGLIVAAILAVIGLGWFALNSYNESVAARATLAIYQAEIDSMQALVDSGQAQV